MPYQGKIYFSSLTCRPGGSDCLSFSAFSLSVILRVYRKREQRTLNLTLSAFFFILTLLASFLLAFSRKSLISLISRGIMGTSLVEVNQAILPREIKEIKDFLDLTWHYGYFSCRSESSNI